MLVTTARLGSQTFTVTRCLKAHTLSNACKMNELRILDDVRAWLEKHEA